MSAFSDIELEWQGRVYTIKSFRVMGAICRIEEVITLPELTGYLQRGAPPLGKLASAFGAVLRYAGAKVSDDDVFVAMFEGPDPQEVVTAAVTKLLMMMLPPAARAKLEEMLASGDADETGGVPPEGNSPAAVAPTSKRRTKQRSQSGGG